MESVMRKMAKPQAISCLCTEAKHGKKLNPTACQTCESPCEYGKDWLKQLGLERPKKVGSYLYDTYNEHQLPLTIGAIIKRRNEWLINGKN